jgi:hypothetical protein
MPTLVETIATLSDAVVAREQSLENALFALQGWVETHGPTMSGGDREAFSELLRAEQDAPQRDGKPQGDDRSLVSSVLRLHAARLLYRQDESRRAPAPAEESQYGRARQRFQAALREVELAVNEARIDTAIANAHGILGDSRASQRWLHDALARLQAVRGKDLIRLAGAVPLPEQSKQQPLKRFLFRVSGIKQQEIAQRAVLSLRQLAELQMRQVVEMLNLLAESFAALSDSPGAQEVRATLARFEPKDS